MKEENGVGAGENEGRKKGSRRQEEDSSLKAMFLLGTEGRKCFVAPDLSMFSSLKPYSRGGGCAVRTAFPGVCKPL